VELKLTNVARASLEELRLDYQDFLRQHGLPEWEPEHPARKRFKKRRCATLEEVRQWARQEHERQHGQTRSDTDKAAQPEGAESVLYSALVANGALSLLNLCCYLLDRQVAAQAEVFEDEGGFTERLYRVRKRRRDQQ